MNNHQEVIDLAKTLTGNEHLYTLQPFIKITSDTTIGLFLERIVYWSDKSGNKDLRQLKVFYKSAEEWEDELGLSYAQITRARKELESRGFITTRRRKISLNGPPVIHYYANIQAIKDAITQYYESKSSDYANLDNSEFQESLNSKNDTPEIQESASSLNNSSTNSSPNGEDAEAPPDLQKRVNRKTYPAVKVFIEVTNRYVLNNTQMDEINQRVGNDPARLEKWRKSVKAWQMHGNKINNADGMLEWFEKRDSGLCPEMG